MSSNFEYDFLSMSEVNPSEFRFWQDILPFQIRILVERSAWANYLTYGITEDALQNDIVMLDNEGNEHPKHKETIADPRYQQIKEAEKRIIGDYLSFGWSYGAVLELGENTILKSFTSSDVADGANVSFDIDEETAEILKAELEIEALNTTIKKEFNTKADLEKGYLLINEHGSLYKGWSYLAPIFDLLFAEWALHQQLSIFVIRVAGGIHIMLMDESMFGNDTNASQMRAGIKQQMDRMGKNTKLIAPKTINGVDTEYKLYTGEGNQNWAEMQEVLLTPIAGYTGIPVEALKGSPTAYSSSQEHSKKHLRQVEKIQNIALRLHKWAMNQVFGIDADYKIEEFKEMTEQEAVELKTKKLNALATISDKAEGLGLSAEALLEYLEIDMEVDQALIEAKQARADEMAKGFGNPDDPKEPKEEEED